MPNTTLNIRNLDPGTARALREVGDGPAAPRRTP